jgi:TM2 domain-containing membrane protein YozV
LKSERTYRGTFDLHFTRQRQECHPALFSAPENPQKTVDWGHPPSIILLIDPAFQNPPGVDSMSRELTTQQLEEAKSKKMIAGICGILIGGLGVHKFILGNTTPGLIMLLVTILTLGCGGFIMGPIGLIEGIMYLTKSDEDFYQTYMVEKKAWF